MIYQNMVIIFVLFQMHASDDDNKLTNGRLIGSIRPNFQVIFGTYDKLKSSGKG